MVWQRLNVFWFSKVDPKHSLNVFWFSKVDPTGHNERRKTNEEVVRRRGGKKILKSGQEWTLPAQLGQLKTGKCGRDCCKVICDAPKTFQGYGIEQNRMSSDEHTQRRGFDLLVS